MADKVTLQEEKILEEWSLVIQNAQGKGQEVYKEISKLIQESQAPGVATQMITAKIEATLMERFVLKKETERQYLNVINENMKDFRFYVGARDYGRSLDISWYLTCEPGMLKKAFSRLLTKGESENSLSFALNLFERQDLRAYVTVAHHCVLEAVSSVMTSLGQDPSQIDRKSKGFMGIS